MCFADYLVFGSHLQRFGLLILVVMHRPKGTVHPSFFGEMTVIFRFHFFKILTTRLNT